MSDLYMAPYVVSDTFIPVDDDWSILPGWKGVIQLGAEDPRAAVMNAESITYTVFVAKMVSIGFTVDKHGQLIRMVQF